jgi:hypothetical protein
MENLFWISVLLENRCLRDQSPMWPSDLVRDPCFFVFLFLFPFLFFKSEHIWNLIKFEFSSQFKFCSDSKFILIEFFLDSEFFSYSKFVQIQFFLQIQNLFKSNFCSYSKNLFRVEICSNQFCLKFKFYSGKKDDVRRLISSRPLWIYILNN